eukprot:SAG22_NODE_147_length_17533_cov_46.384536_15_plen_103_part_00
MNSAEMENFVLACRRRLGLPTGWHLFIRFNEAQERYSEFSDNCDAVKPSWVMRAYTPTSLDSERGVLELVIKIYRAVSHSAHVTLVQPTVRFWSLTTADFTA